MALFHQVKQATWRSDDDVRARSKTADLRVFTDAAEDERLANRKIAAVKGDVVGDLAGEFTCRRENQSARETRLPLDRFGREQVENRQCERGGFTRAGLRDTNKIAAFQQRRNRLRLDGRWMRVGFVGQSTLNRRSQRQRGKKNSGISHKRRSLKANGGRIAAEKKGGSAQFSMM